MIRRVDGVKYVLSKDMSEASEVAATVLVYADRAGRIGLSTGLGAPVYIALGDLEYAIDEVLRAQPDLPRPEGV